MRLEHQDQATAVNAARTMGGRGGTGGSGGNCVRALRDPRTRARARSGNKRKRGSAYLGSNA